MPEICLPLASHWEKGCSGHVFVAQAAFHASASAFEVVCILHLHLEPAFGFEVNWQYINVQVTAHNENSAFHTQPTRAASTHYRRSSHTQPIPGASYATGRHFPIGHPSIPGFANKIQQEGLQVRFSKTTGTQIIAGHLPGPHCHFRPTDERNRTESTRNDVASQIQTSVNGIYVMHFCAPAKRFGHGHLLFGML